MIRTSLTHDQQTLAAVLLGGIPGCRGIVATGVVSREEAAVAYEWLRYLAMASETKDQSTIDRLYLAISIVEGCEPEIANEIGLAA